jgi:hypothetical protein
MTRREQIQEAAMTWLADKYGAAQNADLAFEAGAEWADQTNAETIASLILSLDSHDNWLKEAESTIAKYKAELEHIRSE